jgi:ubiquitin carboxyl-terminal hydrolase MINDY-1/2
LYAFLKALHTGMNVNPRFIQEQGQRSHTRAAPGGFEATKEMRLYSTFGIPLFHGWLPVLESPEYQAFARSAATYEDAQNVQFHEDELEDKLTVGLSEQEQDLFEDLHTIKQFLQTWPTQLTDYGLTTLHENLPGGSFAILFRNDHFSTLYKEPRANQLMTLVTDAGYASHDEIVWENLLDVNGQAAELFSGDFRPVSHASNAARGPGAGPRNSSLTGGQNIQSMLDVGSGSGSGSEWTTVPGRASASNANLTAEQPNFGLSDSGLSRTEQEDHDLALALQLQEEEEDRARQREAERQREDRLSSQLLDGGSGRGRGRGVVNIPVSGRGSGRPGGRPGVGAGAGVGTGAGPGAAPGAPRPLSQSGRPAIPPRRAGQGRGVHRPAGDGDGEIPPPTYEDAASAPPFLPPSGHPANPQAPLPGQTGPQRPGMAPPGGYRPPPGQPGMGRGYGRGDMMAGGRDDRDRCIIM